MAYRSSAAAQKMIAWDDDETPTAWVNPEDAAKAAIELTRLWISTAHATKSLVCLTGDWNFRKAIAPSYKANRSGVVRPLALKHVRKRLAEEFPTASVDGLEADDLMGLMLTAPKAAARTVCVSIDKDLRTVPGLHLNPMKESRPVFVTAAEANRWWFTQTLTGDACDGYPGCPGVGPAKAEAALKDWDGVSLEEGWEIVSRTFAWWMAKRKLPGDPTEAALVQARLSRILRGKDYDKKRGEVVLWHPTSPSRLALGGILVPALTAAA